MSPKLGLLSLVFLLVVPPAVAQDAAPRLAFHDLMLVEIDLRGDMRVEHTVKSSEDPVTLPLIGSNAAGLSVLDEEGGGVQFAATDDGSRILLEPSESRYTVQYDLPGRAILNDRMWTVELDYYTTVAIFVPDAVDLIFANGNPVYLGEKKGISCHGCNVLLEYATEDQKALKNVSWGENEFLVELRTVAQIDRFEFDQPSKSMRFDVAGGGFVTAIIPSELLGGPYAVLLDGQKINFQEYNNNGTHVWVSAKPDVGSMEIIGTTAIPEFSLMLPLVAGLVMALAIMRTRGAGLKIQQAF